MVTAAEKKAAEAQAKADKEAAEAEAAQAVADKEKAEAVEAAAIAKKAAKAAKGKQLYINNSTNNIYTTAGRCGPSEKVMLDQKEAEAYKEQGLESCQGT